ncbi:MAG: c-type cytochrome [Steroidobacteraceae bacterium]
MKVRPLPTLAATVIALGSASTLSQTATAGDAAKGKQAYLNYDCYTCHGRVGEGGNFLYPAPPLAGLDMPTVALQAFLRAAPNDMPSFAPAILTNDDIANIAAFLKSLPGRRDPKDFPLLNQ